MSGNYYATRKLFRRANPRMSKQELLDRLEHRLDNAPVKTIESLEGHNRYAEPISNTRKLRIEWSMMVLHSKKWSFAVRCQLMPVAPRLLDLRSVNGVYQHFQHGANTFFLYSAHMDRRQWSIQTGRRDPLTPGGQNNFESSIKKIRIKQSLMKNSKAV